MNAPALTADGSYRGEDEARVPAPIDVLHRGAAIFGPIGPSERWI